MFDDVSDAAVVAAIEETTRAEAIAAAKRSALVAELASRRRVDADDEERQLWLVDPWAATAAEISAAMGIGTYAASKEMCIALALRDRLPKVAALYAEGAVSARVISTITWRTRLVAEGAPLEQIDAAVADAMTGWGVLSGEGLERAVDVWVERFDPAAVIQGRIDARDRDFRVGARKDGAMTTSVWGRLSPENAELLQRRIDQLVGGVCANDPRTAAQRRSDAAGVLAVYGDRMACLCGSPDCAATAPDARAEAIVIHILADETAAATPCDGTLNGNGVHVNPAPAAPPVPAPASEAPPAEFAVPAPEDAAQPEAPPADRDFAPAKERPAAAPTAPPVPAPAEEPPAAAPAPAAPAPPVRAGGTAVIVGGGVVPPQLLAEMIRAGAKLAPLRRPSDDPEPRYRPSARLAAFVRMRDLTCRFPGCHRPADRADIDHTTPYPAGATCVANTKCLCRLHHLLKTFWIGIGGWADQQLPDGTVIWTSPTGRHYRTSPGGRLFFPDWDTTTAGLPPPTPGAPPVPSRELKMPRRRRIRAAERRARVAAERARNEAARAEFDALTRQARATPEAPGESEAAAPQYVITTADLELAADHDTPPPF